MAVGQSRLCNGIRTLFHGQPCSGDGILVIVCIIQSFDEDSVIFHMPHVSVFVGPSPLLENPRIRRVPFGGGTKANCHGAIKRGGVTANQVIAQITCGKPNSSGVAFQCPLVSPDCATSAAFPVSLRDPHAARNKKGQRSEDSLTQSVVNEQFAAFDTRSPLLVASELTASTQCVRRRTLPLRVPPGLSAVKGAFQLPLLGDFPQRSKFTPDQLPLPLPEGSLGLFRVPLVP